MSAESLRTPIIATPTTTLTVHPKMSERDLLEAVLSLCKLYSWRTLHIRPARTDKGWRSPLQGDGVGWPDLLMLRGTRLIAAELKSATGKITEEQDRWLQDFAILGAETAVWRPADWHDGTILRVLSIHSEQGEKINEGAE